MCGIIGYLGKNSFIDYVLSGLKLVQNRGYDSVGIGTISENIKYLSDRQPEGTISENIKYLSDRQPEGTISENIKYLLDRQPEGTISDRQPDRTISENQIQIIKYASTNTFNSLEQVEKSIASKSEFSKSNIGIGHTRWATHGGKTDINAHPHMDTKERIALVHNGIIENFSELKYVLIKQGYQFKSSTDTEVISVQIGYWLDQGFGTAESIRKTIEMLRGTWALAIIDVSNPSKLWITRNGSPLLLGLDESFVMVVSEQIAFGSYINRYVVLDNHDLIEVTYDSTTSRVSYSKDIHSYDIKTKTVQSIQLTPEPYKYWMEKEIREQPDAITRALNNGGRIESSTTVKLGGLDGARQHLMELDHLILLGCGTSYNAGLWSLPLFKSLDIFDTVSIYDGAEFVISDIPKRGKTGLVFLSQSGETKDLHRCLQIAKDYGLITIGVVNVVDSMIPRETTCGVYLNAGREVGVASTKSFTSQCVVLSLIAIWFSQCKGTCLEKRRKIISDLRNLSWQIENVISQWDQLNPLVQTVKLSSSCFVLAKGSDEAIAKEAALKLKEIAYIHAEGFSSSALKHGPFALITPGLPIFILDTNPEFHDKNTNAFQEVKAREARVVLIGSGESCLLQTDYSKTFGGLLANVFLQILSFELALGLGTNPDYPRNLAKVVTVE